MREPSPYTRRMFLQRGLTFVSLASTAPMFLQRSARGMMLPAGSAVGGQPGVPEDRVLVVVQLGGGNDGLNTVVPFGSREYYTNRPRLAIPEPGRANGALVLDDAQGLGLHPNFSGFKTLMDEGIASVAQGVGYPNPNRSHFTSMDIWHTADTKGGGRGWLGRYVDCTCAGTPEPSAAVALGRTAPLAMVGDRQQPISFESTEMFRWLGSDLHDALTDPYEQIATQGSLEGVDEKSQLGFLVRTSLDAQVSSQRIRRAVQRSPLVPYPNSKLAEQLRTVGAMIRDELPTRVYYVTLGGFDTHANQPGTHGNLLRQLGDSLLAFRRDLEAQGNQERVLTMVFSEFGRRVAQNASGGTDHGTAAPMYFMGTGLVPGVRGAHPSMSDLDAGDLRFTVDFRCIYAAVLEDWLGADARAVLGTDYRKAKIIA